MKAAVLNRPAERLEIEDLEIDPPGPNEVAIRIVASGICHSDYSVIHGMLRSPLPVVPGHEGAGIVAEAGPGVVDLSPGDHVIATLTPACGSCPMCAEEKPFLCFQMGHTMGKSRCWMARGACVEMASPSTSSAAWPRSPSVR